MSHEPSCLRLGVLDLCLGAAGQSVREVLLGSIEQAVRVEALGYSRYWLAEHHGPGTAHSCPEMLTGMIAQATERIRVGTAAILLKYYSPLKVAKDFRLLQALFPGRIDLGVGAGNVDEETARGLLGGSTASLDYGEKVSDLLACLRNQKQHVTPRGVGMPEVWILGGGGMHSAKLAAQHGTAYGMALFLGGNDDPASVQAYRAHFQPSRSLPKPRWNIAVAGVCADTEEEAQRLAGLMNNPYLVPTVVGAPEQCRARLHELARRYETDEIIFTSLIADPKARLRSYRLLAQALTLSTPTVQPAPAFSSALLSEQAANRE